MKMRLWSLLLVGVVLTGCRAGTLQQAAALESTQIVNPALTMEEAQGMALDHAGLAADQVTGLHTEYEIEHGTPIYDVEFRHGNWEYDYAIHADTGELLAFSKDD